MRPNLRIGDYCSELMMSVNLPAHAYGKQAAAEIGIVKVLNPTFIE
jgi:hypothetical protein